MNNYNIHQFIRIMLHYIYCENILRTTMIAQYRINIFGATVLRTSYLVANEDYRTSKNCPERILSTITIYTDCHFTCKHKNTKSGVQHRFRFIDA